MMKRYGISNEEHGLSCCVDRGRIEGEKNEEFHAAESDVRMTASSIFWEKVILASHYPKRAKSGEWPGRCFYPADYFPELAFETVE